MIVHFGDVAKVNAVICKMEFMRNILVDDVYALELGQYILGVPFIRFPPLIVWLKSGAAQCW
jgi:hypothetical protein